MEVQYFGLPKIDIGNGVEISATQLKFALAATTDTLTVEVAVYGHYHPEVHVSVAIYRDTTCIQLCAIRLASV